jgi:hypothetical protein
MYKVETRANNNNLHEMLKKIIILLIMFIRHKIKIIKM